MTFHKTGKTTTIGIAEKPTQDHKAEIKPDDKDKNKKDPQTNVGR